MEKLAALLIPVILGLVLLRLLALPVKLLVKLALHAAFGFGCLWLLNTLTPFTGVVLPINAVTVLTAGVLGLPGIGILVLLTFL